MGAVCLIAQIAKRLGIQKALGNSPDAKLALWQITARIIAQGSRLSAVRLAETCALVDILGIEQGFDEERLYRNLTWLAQNQPDIEQKLYAIRDSEKKIESLFLYDVTSSYLEGQCNELADFGYNRDKKKGKKQIVIGLLCDAEGIPISVEVFQGNRNDVTTLSNQIHKAAECFGAHNVVFVGDRGMIKQGGIEELKEAGFHYITALTRVQIQKLVSDDRIQIELFDEDICEIQLDEERLILRRNPIRAMEIQNSRKSKLESVQKLVNKKNTYLKEHRRASFEVAAKAVQLKIDKLNISSWISVIQDQDRLVLEIDEDTLYEMERLDGCYALRSDLTSRYVSADIIHSRYKDLTKVEQAFRTCKSGNLELRPVFVRKEESTRGHVLVVMLAYIIQRELDQCWKNFNLTVKEGIEILGRICEQRVILEKGVALTKIPRASGLAKELLEAAGVSLPVALSHNGDVKVHTKKRLARKR